MRKISEDAYNAFMTKRHFKSGNTEVSIHTENDSAFMYLFGNLIAKYIVDDIFISDGNYGYSRTTQDRLNTFPITLRMCKNQWILNEKEIWDGKWRKIN
jgi:hypothetical protein